jgi:hypothetical protein
MAAFTSMIMVAVCFVNSRVFASGYGPCNEWKIMITALPPAVGLVEVDGHFNDGFNSFTDVRGPYTANGTYQLPISSSHSSPDSITLKVAGGTILVGTFPADGKSHPAATGIPGWCVNVTITPDPNDPHGCPPLVRIDFYAC